MTPSKTPEENTGEMLFDINHSNIFLDLFPKAKRNKRINKRGLINQKLIQQGSHWQNEKITHGMEKISINNGTNIQNVQVAYTFHQK